MARLRDVEEACIRWLSAKKTYGYESPEEREADIRFAIAERACRVDDCKLWSALCAIVTEWGGY